MNNQEWLDNEYPEELKKESEELDIPEEDSDIPDWEFV